MKPPVSGGKLWKRQEVASHNVYYVTFEILIGSTWYARNFPLYKDLRIAQELLCPYFFVFTPLGIIDLKTSGFS